MMRAAHFARIIGTPPAWPTWVTSGHRRRSDALLRGTSAAVDLLIQDGWQPAADTAVVVSTSYGAVDATWRFGTSIASHGDAGASPTPFTSSVHNACAGNLGELLSLHGPCSTLSQGQQGTHAALRWAALMLASQRAPAVLALIGDRHNDWSRTVVAELTKAPWPIGDGVVAVLLTTGPGRGRMIAPADPTDSAQALQLDAGALTAGDEALLAAWPGERRSVGVQLNQWWPCATLAQIDAELWTSSRPLAVAEAEDGRCARWRLDPWAAGPQP